MVMEEVYDLREEVRLLDPNRVRISVDAFGELSLDLDGDGVARTVRAALAFPLSAPRDFVLLSDDDGEIGAIRALADLDDASRRVLEAALEEAYFVPVITRVYAIQVEFRIPHWEVETDRGPRSFEISSMRSDVRQLANGRILIRDADGNRYDIPDRHKLDAASRALVDGQL